LERAFNAAFEEKNSMFNNRRIRYLEVQLQTYQITLDQLEESTYRREYSVFMDFNKTLKAIYARMDKIEQKLRDLEECGGKEK